MSKFFLWIAMALLACNAHAADGALVFKAGDPSLQVFLLGNVPHPEDNQPSPARIALGKQLFFDPRLSGDGNMSCATCHNPSLGWSDGQPTARGVKSTALGRASPTIYNTAYNTVQMWDGRKKSLEDQAMGPMQANVEMNTDLDRLFHWLRHNAGYQALFDAAYPGEGINEKTLSKAIANFERTMVSRDSPFDRWVRGDAAALSAQQVDGFKLFAGKGQCIACHSGPNFTDNGFHNLGLASWGVSAPDMGRYAQKPVNAAKGAFKTPTVREVARTGPYFHDGSAATLLAVVEHYDRGGEVKSNISPDMRPLGLSQAEKEALVAFMEGLSSPFPVLTLTELPAR
jgi:cytochrome c peroxidase